MVLTGDVLTVKAKDGATRFTLGAERRATKREAVKREKIGKKENLWDQGILRQDKCKI